MSIVLITGPTGFLGRHCLDRLLSEDCEIHAVSRRHTASGGDRVHWHAADLRDPAQARELILAIRPSHLLHLAWEATPRIYSASPENLRWLEAGLAMVASFGEAGGRRFVGAGTSVEYESGHERCTEDVTPIRPSTIYGKCKAACSLAVEAAAQHYGFAAAWGRIFLPYGPGDPPGRLIPSVLASLDQRRPVETTHGRQLRDFIYAPDAADLLVRLLFSSEAGAFNIGTGCATTIRSVIEYLAERRGGRELVRLGAIEPPPGEPPRLIADMTKVHGRLGWSPATSIEAGLTRVLGSDNNRSTDRQHPPV
jgi:nucleoside-diphosphate-sugar epimerase